MRGQNIPVICTFWIFPCVLFWAVKLPSFYMAHYIHTHIHCLQVAITTLEEGSWSWGYPISLYYDHLHNITHPAQERLAAPPGSTSPDLPCLGYVPKEPVCAVRRPTYGFSSLSEKTRKSNIVAFSIQLRLICLTFVGRYKRKRPAEMRKKL